MTLVVPPPDARGCCLRKFIWMLLGSFVVAQLDESNLRIALHDKCDYDDAMCGSCCCKPLLVSGLNETNFDEEPAEALCLRTKNLPIDLPNGTKTLKLLNSAFEEMQKNALDPARLVKLETIYIWKNSALRSIRNHSFEGFLSLRTIIFEDLPHLTLIEPFAFSNLTSLHELRFKNTGINSIPRFTGLSNFYQDIPPLKLTIEDAKLRRISTGSFRNLPDHIKIVYLTWNEHLSTIEDYAFNGSSITQLVLSNNANLLNLHDRAFAGLKQLHMLSLQGTPVQSVPTIDLGGLVEIDLKRTPNLLRFSTSQELPALKIAELTYPYHCCALNPYGFGEFFQQNVNVEERQTFPCDSEPTDGEQSTYIDGTSDGFFESAVDDNLPDETNVEFDYFGIDLDHVNISKPINVHIPSDSEVVSHQIFKPEEHENNQWSLSFSGRIRDLPKGERSGEKASSSANDGGIWIDESYETTPSFVIAVPLCYRDVNGIIREDIYDAPIRCTPEPDAFNPCENVLGTTFLPIISWIVSALAILGNFFVILVLSVVTFDKACARQYNHLSVQKFLVLNLAIADICMGLYVLIISAMDARTSGEYYKYGVEWQKGYGCKIAGFLSIFSSQLSVYTLSIISLERWYAIRFAIQLEKRMTIGCARICILVGWILAGVLAALPLVGVNNYEKTSICLPFDVSDTPGIIYVAFLLFIAIGAFFVDVICYIWMYATVRNVGIRESGSRRSRGSVTNSKTGAYHGTTAIADTVVAKRMAILVFTNFACFFPISFFVLTAAAGYPLISISESKILLVIFYPVNSCCNPFLYAIMTKSFRRDLRAWFTSRGYCSHFAAKLNGAYWRRSSMEPSISERRETTIRKRLQRFFKYLTLRKTSPFDDISFSFRGDGRASSNQRRTSLRRNSSKNSYSFYPSKVNQGRKMSYRSCANMDSDVFHTVGNTPAPKKFTDTKSTTAKKSGISNLMCFKPSTQESESERKNSGNRSPEEINPLMENGHHNHNDSKPTNYQFGRRSSRSRHSTTTIETRVTVVGNTKELEEVCSTTV